MRKLIVIFVFFGFIAIVNCHALVQEFSIITSRLILVDVEKLIQIDENTNLFFGVFLDINNNHSRTGGLYILNTAKKYKFIALYLNFETDDEIFVLYTEGKSIRIGPTGSGTVKKDFVVYLYKQEEIVFIHYKDFDIKKRKGKLIKKYIFNLTKLAKELWSSKNLRR